MWENAYTIHMKPDMHMKKKTCAHALQLQSGLMADVQTSKHSRHNWSPPQIVFLFCSPILKYNQFA